MMYWEEVEVAKSMKGRIQLFPEELSYGRGSLVVHLLWLEVEWGLQPQPERIRW